MADTNHGSIEFLKFPNPQFPGDRTKMIKKWLRDSWARRKIAALQQAVADIVVPTRTSQLTNDSGYITSVPVQSVNGQTGAVSLDASDVGALPSGTVIPSKTSDLTNDSGFVTTNIFGTPTAIPSNADLNTYTTPGHYSANSGSVAGSLTHCPATQNFTLLVIKRTDYYLSQIIIASNQYLYHRYSTSGGWSSWLRFTGTTV